jgi:cytochrome bd-type quinol oxidase subunit 2
VEEGLSIAASIVTILGATWQLWLQRSRQRTASNGDTSGEDPLSAADKFDLACRVGTSVCLVLSASAYLFTRAAYRAPAEDAVREAFVAFTYTFGAFAIIGAFLAFAVPLSQHKGTGWPFALFAIPAASIVMMFNLLFVSQHQY